MQPLPPHHAVFRLRGVRLARSASQSALPDLEDAVYPRLRPLLEAIGCGHLMPPVLIPPA